MALHLSVSTEFGIAATYHNIGAAQTNWRDRACSVVLFSYVDEAARAANKQPLGSVNLALENGAFDFPNAEVTRATLYDKIKALPEWQGATDA